MELEQSCSGQAEVAGPDVIEVAGLARRIEELGRGTGRGGLRRCRWRRLVDRLSAHALLLFIGIVSGIVTTIISSWLGLS
jgi:hypothetical protein